MLKIEFCELTFEKISKFSFTENFGSETKIRKFPHCGTESGNFRNTLTIFWKKFRETNVFTKEISKELIWRIISLVRVNFAFLITRKFCWKIVNFPTLRISTLCPEFWAWRCVRHSFVKLPLKRDEICSIRKTRLASNERRGNPSMTISESKMSSL